MSKTIWNWARTARCPPAELALPRDEAEVAALVARCTAEGRTLRVIGAGHSWNAAAMSDDVLVRLDHLSGIRSIDGTRVTVGAGTSIDALNLLLHQRGLALANVGSIGAQSIAGAISTGTHGSGRRHGVLATRVEALRLVCADGTVRVLSQNDDPVLFDQARVSLGCLGIITEVTLRCVPAFRLEVTARPLSIDDAIEQAVAMADASEFSKVWWLPHTDRAVLFTADRTEAPRQSAPVADWFDRHIANPCLFAALMQLGNRWPATVPSVHRLLSAVLFQPTVRVEDSFRALHLAMPPRHRETEWALPLERASEALGGVRKIIEDRSFTVNFIVELRYVAGDALPLSPAFRPNGDLCYIGGYTGYGADAEPYMDAVEALALALDGRPHWGKRFGMSADALRGRYPGWADFAQTRAELDPTGTFASPFVRAVFGL